MVRANEAYEQESEQRLAELLHEWHCATGGRQGSGAGGGTDPRIRKIHRCEERLMAINLEMDKLQTGGIFGMKMIAEEAEQFERDFLTEMTGRLDAEIEGAKALLLRLGGTLPPPQLTGPSEPEAQPARRIE